MTIGRWPAGFVIAAIVLIAAGCATMRSLSQRLPGAVSPPASATGTGPTTQLRANLDLGQARLREGDHLAAFVALNRALWELEGIDKTSLRLKELAEAHEAFAKLYASQGKPAWAEEHRMLAVALAKEASRPGPQDPVTGTLGQGKRAYEAANFRGAVAILHQALVDAEWVPDANVRLRHLEEIRCYLGFSHVALDDAERARTQFYSLWALDPSVAFCMREAPPAARALIRDVQSRSARLETR